MALRTHDRRLSFFAPHDWQIDWKTGDIRDAQLNTAAIGKPSHIYGRSPDILDGNARFWRGMYFAQGISALTHSHFGQMRNVDVTANA
jgi:hypothetical protein